MDEMHRKLKYQEYMEKMDEARKSVSSDLSLKSLKSRTDSILEDLRSGEDIGLFNQLLWLMTILSGASFIWHYIKFGFGVGFVGIILLIAFLIGFRMIILNKIKEAKETVLSKTDDLDEKGVLRSKLRYVSSGIDVKIARIKLVRWMYTILFPLTIYCLSSVLKNIETTKGAYIWSLILAFLIGGIFWYYYFRGDLDDLEADQHEVNEYITDLK